MSNINFYEKELEDYIEINVEEFISNELKRIYTHLENIKYIGRQIKIGTRITDMLFIGSTKNKEKCIDVSELIIVELKAVPITIEHINQVLDYQKRFESISENIGVDSVSSVLIGTNTELSLHYEDIINFIEIKPKFEFVSSNYTYTNDFKKELLNSVSDLNLFKD